MNIFGGADIRPQSHRDVVKIDRSTGYVLLRYFYLSISRFAEFPPPGDTKKQMLPIYIDPEETKSPTFLLQNDSNSKPHDNLDYWMPVPTNTFVSYLSIG